MSVHDEAVQGSHEHSTQLRQGIGIGVVTHLRGRLDREGKFSLEEEVMTPLRIHLRLIQTQTVVQDLSLLVNPESSEPYKV